MSDRFLEVKIVGRHEQADGIVALELERVGGGPLPPFEPGSHVDIMIAPGLVRQYSLCGDPAQTDRYRIGILLDPASRGGSAAIHERFHSGQRIQISEPRNNFPLAQDAALSVLIAGGIGVTPLLAMAHHLDVAGKAFTFHYSARSRGKAAFLEELTDAAYSGSVHLHFDDGPAEQRLDPKRNLPPPEAGAHLYVCGPTGFMDWILEAARALGYSEDRVHREYFGAAADTSGSAFDVVLSKTGRTVQVAAGQSIIQALERVGVRVEVSCEQGVCGTCLCNVLEGLPDHRDSYLTDEEKAGNDQMLLCCSRARTPRLVLDL